MRRDPEDVLRNLRELREKDPSYSKGEVLGAMITEPPDYAVEAFKMFIDTNLNDPFLFRNAYMLERECVSWFSKLLHGGGNGILTYGGTESNITALYVLREHTGGSVVIAPASAHVSIRKACRILDLELVSTGLDMDHNPIIGEIRDAVEDNEGRVACIVLTAGTTDLGIIEPVEEVYRATRDYNVPIHVDAAFGGIIASLLERVGWSMPSFDFRIPGVATITIDPHKFTSPVPASILLVRSRSLEDKTYFKAPYMPAGYQRTLLGTRTGGSAAAVWSIIEVEGLDGMAKIAVRMMENAEYLARRLEEEGFELVRKPMLPLVVFRVEDRDSVIRELWRRRLFVTPSTIPGAIRVVVEKHITKSMIDNLVDTLKSIVKD